MENTPNNQQGGVPARKSSKVALLVMILLALGVMYLLVTATPRTGVTPPPPASGLANPQSAEINAVAGELEAFSAEGLDAELGQIEQELAQ